ncbi:hypothetical protein TSUD_157100 [Trifolium subterraneum]|uniref:Uncharacterized protein n=1 Tax=Trifolium subterraneum TaxID=3900 RepID=A0A2Z6N6G1_TRISU|nr:hypothetical protein TSUD_157100 [Trifolium subterraneum]
MTRPVRKHGKFSRILPTPDCARQGFNFINDFYIKEDRVSICEKFKVALLYKLHEQPFGYLQHPNGKSYMVGLNLDEGDCYMTSGIHMSNKFGFKAPTNVILEYQVVDNIFKMHVIKNEDVVTITSDDEEDDGVISDDGGVPEHGVQL